MFKLSFNLEWTKPKKKNATSVFKINFVTYENYLYINELLYINKY